MGFMRITTRSKRGVLGRTSEFTQAVRPSVWQDQVASAFGVG